MSGVNRYSAEAFQIEAGSIGCGLDQYLGVGPSGVASRRHSSNAFDLQQHKESK